MIFCTPKVVLLLKLTKSWHGRKQAAPLKKSCLDVQRMCPVCRWLHSACREESVTSPGASPRSMSAALVCVLVHCQKYFFLLYLFL
jgi:hypothetical protein